jgi:methionyl-tRNA formyltransferase
MSASNRSAYLAGLERALVRKGAMSFAPTLDIAPARERARNVNGSRVVFAGFPSEFSLAFLLALTALDVDVVGLLTSPGAHPAVQHDNALTRIADHLGIPLLRAWDVNGVAEREQLAALAPDAVVMASFDQVVRPAALAVPRCGWLNIHPSALPAYRGPEPVFWAIADGASTSGVTLHRVVPQLDAGPILAQQTFPLRATETAATLTYRAVRFGTRLLAAALADLLAGARGRFPDLSAGCYRSSIGVVDLAEARSALQAERLVRAGHPENAPWADLAGVRCQVLRARILKAPRDRPVIRYPDGVLEILETVAPSPDMRAASSVRDRTWSFA